VLVELGLVEQRYKAVLEVLDYSVESLATSSHSAGLTRPIRAPCVQRSDARSDQHRPSVIVSDESVPSTEGCYKAVRERQRGINSQSHG